MIKFSSRAYQNTRFMPNYLKRCIDFDRSNLELFEPVFWAILK